MNITKQLLRVAEYGPADGNLVIYFHGVPGSPEDSEVFSFEAKVHNLRFICLDRFSIDSSIRGEAYYKLLAQEILRIADGKKINIVGFSIGAFVATQICRHLESQVRSLHLISAAAPLEVGDYLDKMAGKQVFRLAKNYPNLFCLLLYWQAFVALVYPKALFGLLFASAVGKDKDLAANHEFQSDMIKSLKSCFIRGARGYIRDIDAYVRPWQQSLQEVKVNHTYIWHGSEDNWSPKSMADYLESAIPGQTSLKVFEGLSHYSCLNNSIPVICKLLTKFK